MRVTVHVVLGMLFAVSPVTSIQSDASPATTPSANAWRAPVHTVLEGSWEGFIAETPARLTQCGVRLKPAGEDWEGTIDLPGAEGLPLNAIRANDAELHFELQVGETHFTNGFHSLSKVERPEFEPYLWTDLDLEDLSPDILVRSSSADYFAGRDPAVAAILRKIIDTARETDRS